MNKILIVLSLFFMLSCSDIKSVDDLKKELIDTDIQFSKLSEEKGRNIAFLHYIAENGVMLRAENEALVGKEKIRKLFKIEDDNSYILTWKPLDADVSISGDLGYTYGIYELKIDSIIEKGTYASVWKKNKKGEWKFVLDTGNQGLGK